MNFFKKIKQKLNKLHYYMNFESRHYPYYKKLDIILVYIDNLDIVSIKNDDYYYIFTFSDNTILNFWHTNRWFAFMSQGNITFSNGKILDWCNKAPSYEILYKVKKIILEYEKKQDDNEYYDCLPTKLLRKQKLEKLKK